MLSARRTMRAVPGSACFPEIAIGDRLTLQGVSLDKTTFRVLRGGKELAVTARIAENLWMRRDDPDHK